MKVVRIEIELPEALFSMISKEATLQGETIEKAVISALFEGFKKCLSPFCPLRGYLRGLCRRHYDLVKYHKRTKALHESWLVRHGRLLPKTGDPEPLPDSLETLPRYPKGRLYPTPDARWLFDYPAADNERARLEGVERGLE